MRHTRCDQPEPTDRGHCDDECRPVTAPDPDAGRTGRVVRDRQLKSPFHIGGMFTAGRRVPADTISTLRVLHTLCGQLAATLTAERAEHDRTELLLDELDAASAGARGEVGAHGDTWDTLLINHRWAMTRVYAEAALDYAWAASRAAGILLAGDELTPFDDWPDKLRRPGHEWVLADLDVRLPRLNLPAPVAELGVWVAADTATLNDLISDAHRRMLAAVVALAKVRPVDLTNDQLIDPVPLEHQGRSRNEPRCTQLQDAAAAVDDYAASCARAVVLLNAVAPDAA